jgi:hypothetical protein
MAKRAKGPKRYVNWGDRSYAVRSDKIEIPDLAAMSRFAALQWLVSNTYATGYSRPNPLAGLGGAIAVKGF